MKGAFTYFENEMSGNIGSLSRRIVTGVYLFGTRVHVDKRIAPSANFVSSKTPARQTAA